MVRQPILAGAWYPVDREELNQSITGYFSGAASKQLEGKLLGLVSPHAGHFYSGSTAAAGFSCINPEVDLVVILAPTHQYTKGDYIVNSSTHYLTPLGDVPVDTDAISKLTEFIEIEFVTKEREHAIEIQLPFLQYHLNSFQILPIMIGHDDVFECHDIVEGLIQVCGDRNVIFIASSDMHHLDDYRLLIEKDREVLDSFQNFELQQIRKTLTKRGCTVCGKVPITVVIDVCQKLGADHAEIVQYSNSADITKEKGAGSYTVGYLSLALLKQN